MICPKCKTDHAHRSHREGWKEDAASLLHYYPYRCNDCGIRFSAFRQTEKPNRNEKEIRATRARYLSKKKRRELLLYGSALFIFLAFIYYLTRDHGSPPDGE